LAVTDGGIKQGVRFQDVEKFELSVSELLVEMWMRREGPPCANREAQSSILTSEKRS